MDLIIFEEQVLNLKGQGFLKPLPNKKSNFKKDQFITGHISNIRDRLYRLGYIDSNSELDILDSSLTNGLLKFQHEAEITVDGWLGEETWTALQELFSFEHPINVLKWATKGHKAFHRATILRLSTLGIIKSNRVFTKAEMIKGVNEFHNLIKTIQPSPDEQNIFHLIFDLDEFQYFLLKNELIIRRLLNKGHAKLKRLIYNYLKVELWLLDFELDIKNCTPPNSWRKRKSSRKNKGSMYRYTKAYLEFKKFWKDQGAATNFPNKNIDSVVLLRTLKSLSKIATVADDPEYTFQEIESIYKKNNGLDITTEWKTQESNSKLWDGTKRIWRYLSSLLKRGIKWIIEKTQILLRSLYQKALAGYQIVVNGFQSFSDSIDFLLNKEFKGSNKNIAMCHDKDFDFTVFLSKGTDPFKVSQFLDLLRERVIKFQMTARLIRLIIRVAKLVLKVASGIGTWWEVVKIVIKVLRSKDELLVLQND